MVTSIPPMLERFGENIEDVNFSTHVAGTTYVNNSDALLRFLKEKVPDKYIRLLLVREPMNDVDPNAVRVDISIIGSNKSHKIGYVPRDRADLLSYVLEHDSEYSVNVHDITLQGGEGDKPNVGVFFSYNIMLRRIY